MPAAPDAPDDAGASASHPATPAAGPAEPPRRGTPLAPLLPPDHPDRAALAAEVHARPPEPVAAPARATCIALRLEPEDRDAERAHLADLCALFSIAPPAAALTQWSASLGALRIKWERHGEFSSFTFYAAGLGPEPLAAPFAEPVIARLPVGWLRGLPGQTVLALHAEVTPAPPDDALADPEWLSRCFGEAVVVGARIGDGAGQAYTDFRIHGDGFGRVLLLDRDMTERQAGRMLQRLFEIEAYRMMALLALPLARGLWPRLLAIERRLAALTAQIAHPDQPGTGDDEALLQQLTAVAAEVEEALAASQSRFNASRAYAALVTTRIHELREQRIGALQTFDEFMTRRFSPAMATCHTAQQRLHDLSERVAQASGLLATRVSIARERQNQALLAATARRAQLQLRLQQTVEGLSLAAITYYLAGLVGYGAKALKAAGLPVSPDLLVGLSVPLLAFGAWRVLQRIHHRLAQDEAAMAEGAGTPGGH